MYFVIWSDRPYQLPCKKWLNSDTAPSSRHALPRVALSDMQTLLYVTEDEARQLHIAFNVQKCQLLVIARPGKLRKTLDLLENEPEVLTFYGQPVSIIKPGDHYIHLGVPQAPTNQSKIAVEYRLKNGMEKFYLLQDVIKNSLRGINPSSNQYMLTAYLVHGFIYGLDTIDINPTDLDQLETKYRSILKGMQSLPPSTPTPAVYLMGGVIPAVAERDIQILQLVGQLAICDRSIQAVSDIVESNLGGESIDFAGWSGLARRTAAIYNLIDPLELFQNPWKSERWSKYAKGEVIKYWTNLLHENVASYPSLDMLDTSRLDLSSPHPIWLAAGTNPVSVTKATVVSWLLLNVYKTAERLHKMRKLKSPECLSCLAPVDDEVHFGLQCLSLVEIRSEYMSKFTEACPNISKYLSNPKVLLFSIPSLHSFQMI